MARTAATPGSTEIPADKYPLLDKLSSYLPLSPAEISFLRDLHGSRRQFDRHRDIIAQGRPYRNVFILCSGFVWRYKILPDGKRQLLSFGLPGDLIGFPASFFENAVNATASLTDVVVATVPFAAFYDLFARFPRVAVALYWMAAREAAIYGEHIVDIGRRSAYERLAHLILELLTRLQSGRPRRGAVLRSSADPGADRGCAWPERPACQPDAAVDAGRRAGHHRRPSPDRGGSRVADAARRF